MKITVNSKPETLTLLNPDGLDYAADLVGEDLSVKFDDAGEASCPVDTYKWWADFLPEYQAALDRLEDAYAEHGKHDVLDSIEEYFSVDLEQLPVSIHAGLNEHYGVQS